MGFIILKKITNNDIYHTNKVNVMLILT